MRESYKKRVDEMDLFGEGVCHMCGKNGYHIECDARELEITNKFKENDRHFLTKHAVYKQYGVQADSAESYNHALTVLDDFLAQDPSFDEQKVVEGKNWWYFPNSWIGMLGFIIEKESDLIFPLGSGFGGLRGEYEFVPAHWIGIEAYSNGAIEPVEKS